MRVLMTEIREGAQEWTTELHARLRLIVRSTRECPLDPDLYATICTLMTLLAAVEATAMQGEAIASSREAVLR